MTYLNFRVNKNLTFGDGKIIDFSAFCWVVFLESGINWKVSGEVGVNLLGKFHY